MESGPETESGASLSLQSESNPIEAGSTGAPLPSARSFARNRMEQHLG